MNTFARWLVILLPLAAACSSSGAPPPASVAPARTAVDGKFAHYLVSPRGDVDGAVLEDGTVARFPPGDAPPLQAGDAIHVEGDAVSGPSGRVLTRAVISKGGVVLTRMDMPGPGGPPPPPPHGPRGPRGPEAGLLPMTATGQIQALSTDPRGRVDGIVLADGTSARAGRKARLETLGLKVGDTITITGRGAVYPLGKSLHIETVKLPSGEVRTVERPRAELAPVTHDGTVARVLVNPHGDVDGVLLDDKTLVRVPPQRAGAMLAKGAKLHVEGPGTSSFVEATTLTSGGRSLDLSAAPPPPPVTPPPPLSQLEDKSETAQLVMGPEGDAEALILRDGTLVQLPPALRDDAAPALQVGTTIAVSGEGGTYDGVKSIHARRIELASGQVFEEPSPPSPPDVPR